MSHLPATQPLLHGSVLACQLPCELDQVPCAPARQDERRGTNLWILSQQNAMAHLHRFLVGSERDSESILHAVEADLVVAGHYLSDHMTSSYLSALGAQVVGEWEFLLAGLQRAFAEAKEKVEPAFSDRPTTSDLMGHRSQHRGRNAF